MALSSTQLNRVQRRKNRGEGVGMKEEEEQLGAALVITAQVCAGVPMLWRGFHHPQGPLRLWINPGEANTREQQILKVPSAECNWKGRLILRGQGKGDLMPGEVLSTRPPGGGSAPLNQVRRETHPQGTSGVGLNQRTQGWLGMRRSLPWKQKQGMAVEGKGSSSSCSARALGMGWRRRFPRCHLPKGFLLLVSGVFRE